MAGFWHFLPGVKQTDLVDSERRINAELLKRFGLGDVLADVRTHPDDAVITPLDHGPGGEAGVLLYPVSARGELPRQPAYDPDQQRYERRGERWLGWLPPEPPRPLDLERRVLLNGYFCPDQHGNQWVVPTARGKDHDLGGLPFELLFGEAAEPQPRVAPRYAKIWADAKRVYDHLNRVAEEPVAWLGRVAATSLALNYRVGDQELGCLSRLGRGVFDVDFLLHALMSLVDFNAPGDYLEHKKKLVSLTRVAG